ncbi:helix-turn-helix domain-containing protein [Pseudonocardia sp.]|jgi:AcrR family transcriptional regulator|uniref:TetR/AcrR family transcriptional regulator n=1 Tax=Pseudonocardia sp. TaxID=60912 RepID=UPI002D7EF394|nr:helix-turn-helix domain-containing protein [Pseudonocardia sp.]
MTPTATTDLEGPRVDSPSVLPLPESIQGFPPLPPASLDPFLDATSRCFARYGVRRTSVQDVAQELGVNRTTVYRQVGNIEQQAMLLAARDSHRLLSALPARITFPIGPQSVVDLLATLVREARAHPVLAKMLADERDLIGSFVARDVPDLMERATTAFVPLVSLAIGTGNLARRDPMALAQWLVRITASLILIEPPGELEDFLAELLIPALTPAGPAPRGRRRRSR